MDLGPPRLLACFRNATKPPRRARRKHDGDSREVSFSGLSESEHRAWLRRRLVAAFHASLPIAISILACAVVGIAATALLIDYTSKNISTECRGI
jgi:hypothetical protein